MNTAFVLSGLLLLAGVIGVFRSIVATGRPVARWTSAALLALTPAGLMMVGLFDLPGSHESQRPLESRAGEEEPVDDAFAVWGHLTSVARTSVKRWRVNGPGVRRASGPSR